MGFSHSLTKYSGLYDINLFGYVLGCNLYEYKGGKQAYDGNEPELVEQVSSFIGRITCHRLGGIKSRCKR